MNLSFVIVFVFVAVAGTLAHYDSAYFRSSKDGFTERKRWMRDIPDKYKLSQLAIPGTHDSGADDDDHHTFLKNHLIWTQCLNFDQQLKYGIRFFDIRIRFYRNSFSIHHDSIYLNKNFDDFLGSVQKFLITNPSEVVLFRLKREHTQEENTKTIFEVLNSYLDSYSKYLNTTNRQITLGKARGRFIIFSDNYAFHSKGIVYEQSDIQDNYKLITEWDLYEKWEAVKKHLVRSKYGDSDTFYINYLSGSGGIFLVTPYFVASGHNGPGTRAGRLSTGYTTPGWKKKYPDFPRVDCGWFNFFCVIVFEGTNILARDNIKDGNNRKLGSRTVGIIIADFPGDDLIKEIIRSNWRLK